MISRRGDRDLVAGVGIGQRIDVGGVLRPEDNHRLWRPACAHVVGQLSRFADMIVQHGAALCIEFEPEPRDVALNGGDGDCRVVACAKTRLPDMRPRQRRGQQHGADAHTWQHHGGRRRLLALVVVLPPLHDFEGECGQTKSGQHHRERQQRCTAELRDCQQRSVSLTETDYTPREPTERHGGLEPFLCRPERGEPERPARQIAGEDGRPPEQRGKHRLQDAQRDPRNRTDEPADPGQQRQIEHQPEQESVPESTCACCCFACQHPGEQGERHDGQVPPAERRKAHAQREPGHDHDAQLGQPIHHRLSESLEPQQHIVAPSGLDWLGVVLRGRRFAGVLVADGGKDVRVVGRLGPLAPAA